MLGNAVGAANFQWIVYFVLNYDFSCCAEQKKLIEKAEEEERLRKEKEEKRMKEEAEKQAADEKKASDASQEVDSQENHETVQEDESKVSILSIYLLDCHIYLCLMNSSSSPLIS